MTSTSEPRANSTDTGLYLKAVANCITTPSSLGAIGILLLNDHVLKMLFPSWLTGKLSDFAGLYFAPYLVALALLSAIWLAHLPRTFSSRRSNPLPYPVADAVVTFAFTAVALLFSAVKLAPITAEPALGLVEFLLGSPVTAMVDPSDMMALVVLAPSYLVWRRKSKRLQQEVGPAGVSTPSLAIVQKAAQVALLAVATLAVVATSPSSQQPAVSTIVADPNYPNVLYATKLNVPSKYAPKLTASSQDVRLLRTIDGGGSWTPLGAVDGSWTEAGDVAERVLPDPHHPAAFYMLGRRHITYFEDIVLGRRAIWPPKEVASANSGDGVGRGDQAVQLVAPTWQADLIYVGDRDRIARSQDGGRSWDDLALPGLPDSSVDVLSWAEAQPGLLFAARGTHLYRSEDWGSTWSDLTVLDAQLLDIKTDPKRADLMIAATKRALLKSTDGGLNWRTVWTRPGVIEESTGQILFDTRQDGTIQAAMGTAGLLKSSDQGEHWVQSLAGEVSAVTVTHSRYPRLYVAAVRDGLYRQRSQVHWPWISDWEVMNSGLDVGRSDFGDRLGNLISWLLFLTATTALAGAFAPVRGRSWLQQHVWEISLAFWTLIPSLLFGWGISSGASLERSFDHALFVSLMAVGAIAVLLKARLSWTAWAMIAASQGLLWGTLAVFERGSPIPALVVIPASALAAMLLIGLVLSAAAFRGGWPRQGKILLILTVTAVNLPGWLFFLFTSSFSMGG